jgi:glycosyltransferase involved in cell wall biosynthesis
MLDEYARNDQRVKVIHQNNQGLARARNVALKVASGEYIAFVDADDYIAPSMLEKTIVEADKTKADIVLFATSSFTMKLVKFLQLHGLCA